MIKYSLILFFLTHSLLTCMGSKELIVQEKAPLKIGDCYYQKWIGGLKESAWGYTITIPVEANPKHVILDSVYFRNARAKLIKNETHYSAKLTYKYAKEDIEMTNSPNREFGNTLPTVKKQIPFTLSQNEAVISYTSNKKTAYFKVTNLSEKQAIYYPSAPPKNKQF